MGLDDFNNNSDNINQSDESQSDSYIEVSQYFLHTPCECDISNIFTFGILIDELDVIAHLQKEHGKEFEKATKEVKTLQKLKS